MERIVREAKLFEANNYPDRGINFTEADIDAIISHFQGPVPVKIEHGESPLTGLGEVLKVWRVGKDLMARISFLKPAWDLLQHMGAKRLSVGFDWRQRQISEVSIVRSPRVHTAQVFNEGLTSSADGDTVTVEYDFNPSYEGGVKSMPGQVNEELQKMLDAAREEGRIEGKAAASAQFSANDSDAAVKLARLEREIREKDAMAKIAIYKQEGKIAPASEKYALGIITDGDTLITFADGGKLSIAESFIQFMAHQPAIVDMSGSKQKENDEEKAGEKEVYSVLGLTEEEIKAVGEVE